MLDIYFWLRFPLLLNQPEFVAAALEECRAAIQVSPRQNTEVRLEEWKRRFQVVVENQTSTEEELATCAEEFQTLAVWIERETMRVLARTLTYSHTIVRSTWSEATKTESFDRLAGLYVILKATSERCRQDLQKVKSPEKEAMHK